MSPTRRARRLSERPRDRSPLVNSTENTPPPTYLTLPRGPVAIMLPPKGSLWRCCDIRPPIGKRGGLGKYTLMTKSTTPKSASEEIGVYGLVISPFPSPTAAVRATCIPGGRPKTCRREGSANLTRTVSCEIFSRSNRTRRIRFLVEEKVDCPRPSVEQHRITKCTNVATISRTDVPCADHTSIPPTCTCR